LIGLILYFFNIFIYVFTCLFLKFWVKFSTFTYFYIFSSSTQISILSIFKLVHLYWFPLFGWLKRCNTVVCRILEQGLRALRGEICTPSMGKSSAGKPICLKQEHHTARRRPHRNRQK
jgi:hypothetical protein